MRKEVKNTQGSALVWVLIICVIFGLLGVAIGGIALSMNNRSINNNSRQQAYFTARSGVDIIFAYLNANVAEYAFTQYLYANLINGNHEIKIDNIFEDSMIGTTKLEDMGECSVNATYIDGIVTIKAKAKVAGQEQKITLTVKRNQDGAIWPARVWGKPLKVGQKENILEIGSEKDRNGDAKDAILFNFVEYIVGSGDNYAHKGTLSIVNDLRNKPNANQAIFIYIDKNSSFEIQGIENWDEHYGPDIFIFVDENATLTLKPKSTGLYPIYIGAMTGAQIKLTETGAAKVLFVSGDDSGLDKGITFEKGDKPVPKRIPLGNYYYTGTLDPTNGVLSNKWDVIKYEENK